MVSTEQQLIELPALYAQLTELRTTKTPGTGDPVQVKRIHPPTPVRLEVVDHLDVIRRALRDWCSLHDPSREWGDVMTMCWFLRWALPESPWASELTDAVGGLYHYAREALGEREFRWPTHDACGGQIVEFRCALCHHTWGDRDIVKRLSDLSRTATLSQCSEATEVSLSTLEYWVREGLLEPQTTTRPKTYKLSQVEWLRDRKGARTT